jgi:signal peptidase I
LRKLALAVVDALLVLLVVCAVGDMLIVPLLRADKAPSIIGYSVFQMTSESMEPTIPADSLIVTHQTDPADLAPGDIITFYSSDPALAGAAVTQRIAAVTQEAGEYVFTTSGDASGADDPCETREDDLIGRVVFTSCAIGFLVRLLSKPLVFVPIIVLALAWLLVRNLWHTISLARTLANQQEERAIREAMEEIRKGQWQEQNR